MVIFIKTIVLQFWETMAEMSPYLLFGFLMAGVLSVLISQRTVEKHLGGDGFWPVLKASLFGVPLPLCSCGVIPVSMSLHKHGASKGATISFLLSTPQTGADNFFVILGLLGPVFAIFSPIAAFVTGIVGGVAVNLFGKKTQDETAEDAQCTDDCCNGHEKSNRVIRLLKYAFVTLPRDISGAMLIGLVIAAIIATLIPNDYFAEKLGTGIFAMVVMMLIGIPIYVCATASVPIAAALILKGLTPGAALVFLMTGPATNAASFMTIWKTLGGRTAIIYLLSVAGCALAAGVFLDYIWVGGLGDGAISHTHQMMPDMVKQFCAIALMAILVWGVLTAKKRRIKSAAIAD